MTASAQTALARIARAEIARGSTGPWALAFSGGPDSTALALALRRANLPILVELVHVDHGLEPSSAERAAAAAALAASLGLRFHLETRSVPNERRTRENLEAAARRVRYAALESRRRELGADRILTAHHRDDQAETVLLRLRSGGGALGIAGLAGIRERRGPIWRPALGLGRAELAALLDEAGIDGVRDPSNLDLARARNAVRLRLLPHLRRREPDLEIALAALGARAARAAEALGRWVEQRYAIERAEGGASLDLDALGRHATEPNLLALRSLEEAVGIARPTSRRAKLEILRRTRSGPFEELEAGAGWRFRRRDRRLELAGADSGAGPVELFSYTFQPPGEIDLAGARGVLSIRRAPVEAWMFRGERHRAALRLPDPPPADLEVRNRRPGDRLRPLGAPGMRTLKELLIDRKVPRAERGSLPLLLVGGRIAWIPGVAIAEEFRLPAGSEGETCWIAEWRRNPGPPAVRSTLSEGCGAPTEEGPT